MAERWSRGDSSRLGQLGGLHRGPRPFETDQPVAGMAQSFTSLGPVLPAVCPILEKRTVTGELALLSGHGLGLLPHELAITDGIL